MGNRTDRYPVPETADEWTQCLTSFEWRIYSGHLYKVMVKGDDDDEDAGEIKPFRPNRAQRRILKSMHRRNVVLKARQLGFTTLFSILWLDHALFNENQRVGIVAHNLDDAKVIFRDKVKFVYDNMPRIVRDMLPLVSRNESEMSFDNGSVIRVAVSMRSGTIHRLHVSEMGKIAAASPGKAKEIVTGTFPAVPSSGVVVVESTAEGAEGEFYKLATRAQARCEKGGRLASKEFRFHFFPWHDEPRYQADPALVSITDDEHAYFNRIEIEVDTILTERQRAWYVMTRDSEFSGDSVKMWQEYPSTPAECWLTTTEGRYFAVNLSAARSSGRVVPKIEYDPYTPVDTFWDIGSRDGTGIWLMQRDASTGFFNVIGYIEDWYKGYGHYITLLSQTGYRFGRHYLPHDAMHQRPGANRIISALDMLQQAAPDWDFTVLPRIERKQDSIDLTRKYFRLLRFSEIGCKEGLVHLSNYQARYNTVAAAFSDEPLKNRATEAADALQQWAIANELGAFGAVKKRSPSSRPSGLSS